MVEGFGQALQLRIRMQLSELEMVARDGIEPSTRGLSATRTVQFGARKPKIRNAFPRERPNRPARPSPDRTPQRPADRTPARRPCESTSWPYRDRTLSEPARGAGGRCAFCPANEGSSGAEPVLSRQQRPPAAVLGSAESWCHSGQLVRRSRSCRSRNTCSYGWVPTDLRRQFVRPAAK